jgi:glyoxylase-like metal-dependent hydrolase (beta-lactamase superfamily II)
MKRRFVWAGIVVVGILLAGVGAMRLCATTGHPTVASTLGTASSSAAMLRELGQPGPLEAETVVSAEWAVARSQIINLEHPKAKAAGLRDGDEPIQVVFHVLRHPTRGLFLIDTGVEKALGDDREHAAFHGFIASFMHLEKMKLVHPIGDWIKEHGGKVDGVFFTHLHLDHVTGLPDVPKGTPLYAGPTEAHHRGILNVFSRPGLDRSFEGRPPLNEWVFRPDPDGRFDGVLDVFGDGSLFGLYVPGHTSGSTAYLARTTKGPVLFTGDTASTVWGWEHQVEPGSFTADHAQDSEALAKLHTLVEEYPAIDVRLGHQALRR